MSQMSEPIALRFWICLALLLGACQPAANDAVPPEVTSPPALEETSAQPASMEEATSEGVLFELGMPPAELLPNGRQPFHGVLVGGQPSDEQLAAIAVSGVSMVINLRPPGEPGAGGEARKVEELGMKYVSIPVAGPEDLNAANARLLHDALAEAELPVVVHCASGNRVGGLFALRAHVVEGVGAEEALRLGLDAGLTGLEPAAREALGLPAAN